MTLDESKKKRLFDRIFSRGFLKHKVQTRNKYFDESSKRKIVEDVSEWDEDTDTVRYTRENPGSRIMCKSISSVDLYVTTKLHYLCPDVAADYLQYSRQIHIKDQDAEKKKQQLHSSFRDSLEEAEKGFDSILIRVLKKREQQSDEDVNMPSKKMNYTPSAPRPTVSTIDMTLTPTPVVPKASPAVEIPSSAVAPSSAPPKKPGSLPPLLRPRFAPMSSSTPVPPAVSSPSLPSALTSSTLPPSSARLSSSFNATPSPSKPPPPSSGRAGSSGVMVDAGVAKVMGTINGQLSRLTQAQNADDIKNNDKVRVFLTNASTILFKSRSVYDLLKTPETHDAFFEAVYYVMADPDQRVQHGFPLTVPLLAIREDAKAYATSRRTFLRTGCSVFALHTHLNDAAMRRVVIKCGEDEHAKTLCANNCALLFTFPYLARQDILKLWFNRKDEWFLTGMQYDDEKREETIVFIHHDDNLREVLANHALNLARQGKTVQINLIALEQEACVDDTVDYPLLLAIIKAGIYAVYGCVPQQSCESSRWLHKGLFVETVISMRDNFHNVQNYTSAWSYNVLWVYACAAALYIRKLDSKFDFPLTHRGWDPLVLYADDAMVHEQQLLQQQHGEEQRQHHPEDVVNDNE